MTQPENKSEYWARIRAQVDAMTADEKDAWLDAMYQRTDSWTDEESDEYIYMMLGDTPQSSSSSS